MSYKPFTNLVVGTSLLVIAALGIGSRVQAGPAAPAGGMQMTDTQMKDHCKDMMDQKKELAADVKSQDAELTEMVAKMNRAPEDKQLGLMAAVVTRMAEQRVAMNARHAKMDDEMTTHMMQHKQMGKDAISECPMMNGMKDMDDTSMGAHK